MERDARGRGSRRTALLALLPLLASACLERRGANDERKAHECTACHGELGRSGDAITRSAPPRDLHGNRGTEYPGVGAHAQHLYGSPTHGPVPCVECHVVPERTTSPGHADTSEPAELIWGPLATQGGRSPTYDRGTRGCSDSYCHRASDAVWTQPRTSEQACGSCHGLPPPPPHPESDQCFACHGEVIGIGNVFADPKLHVDGQVQVRDVGCSDCHGSPQTPAPPVDLARGEEPTSRGVGAHTVHLQGGGSGRPLACEECHHVPATTDDPAHFGPLPADVQLTGVASAYQQSPSYDAEALRCADSWCHGPRSAGATSPAWNSNQPLDCAGCHGLPPPAPHPQVEACSLCHGDVVAPDQRTIVARERHVDGVVDLLELECTSCHGDMNPAPPKDLSGATDPSSPGVGAHQTHLSGGNVSRPVFCRECHVVPNELLSPGHVDSFRPAELRFGGAAIAYDAKPVYTNGTCANTYCHGAQLSGGDPSGGSLTVPSWTTVDGSQSACGTCHGLPPPPPHPARADCSACHQNIASDGTFIRRDLHVNGDVTFSLR